LENRCQSPNDAVEVESSDIDQDCFVVLKPVHVTHGHTVSNHRLDVLPSVKQKHRRPLSVHSSQRLLVKGFTFSQICKKIRKVESSFVKGDRNGCSEEACMASEMIALQNGDIRDSCRLERCVQPQKRPVDGSLNDEHVSVMTKCGQKMEYGSDSGIAVRTTKGCAKANGLLVEPVDAVIVRRRGRPRKRPLVGSSCSDSSMSVMQKNRNANTVVVRRGGRPHKMSLIGASLIGDQNEKTVTVKRCGQPRKMSVINASLTDENKLVTTKCGEQEELHCVSGNEGEQTDGLEKANEVVRSPPDANTVVRKRGRPRKISIDDASLIGENMSVATKSREQEEHHCVSGNEVGQTDGLVKANEVVSSPPDANTVVRKRGRPRKMSIGDASLIGENMSVATKCGEQEELHCISGNEGGQTDGLEKANKVVRGPPDANTVVRKRGRPRKVSIGDASLIGENMLLATKCGEQEELHCISDNEVGQTDGLEKANKVVRSSTDANTVVRKRGQPRNISVIRVSLIGGNVVVATKSGEQEERHCENGISVRETDGPQKANEVVRSSTDANTVVRKCNRPRTRTVDSTSSDDNAVSLLTEHQDANSAVVRRLGRPCKRPRDDLSSNDEFVDRKTS